GLGNLHSRSGRINMLIGTRVYSNGFNIISTPKDVSYLLGNIFPNIILERFCHAVMTSASVVVKGESVRCTFNGEELPIGIALDARLLIHQDRSDSLRLGEIVIEVLPSDLMPPQLFLDQDGLILDLVLEIELRSFDGNAKAYDENDHQCN